MPDKWCDAAKIRREQIESGIDLTFNEVFRPFLVDLIKKFSPSEILEVGAGTGHLSKDLFEEGFTVTAIEPSLGMYKVAQEVLSSTEVALLNCASYELEKNEKYDLAFSHLVAHVVDDLSGFFHSIGEQLSRNGRFIFTIPHPCFYNEYKGFFGNEYNYMSQLTKSVSFTISLDSHNVISEVPYHHRPLSVYFNSLITSGFTITQFDETYPHDEIQQKYGATWNAPRYCTFTGEKR